MKITNLYITFIKPLSDTWLTPDKYIRPHGGGTIFMHCLVILLLFSSCIKSYEPVIEPTDAVKFVVTGQVYSGDEVQVVNISTTSPVGRPKYLPLEGCTVFIIDGNGVSYAAEDKKKGKYEVVIPPAALIPGASFKVDILIPGGTHIVSGYDQINKCPDLGEIYYELKDVATENPKIFGQGIQFYVDLDAENVTTRNFMWELNETWEDRAALPIEWYYDGKLHQILPPSDSLQYCWKTNTEKNVFTLSTKDFSQNKYKRFELNLVDNFSSQRLVYGYSLLVRQIALSDAAYNYWNKIEHNSNNQGGLYEKQPLVIKGNLYNLTNPEQDVLGFFGAGEVKSKRVFVKEVEDMDSLYDPGCTTDGMIPRRGGLRGIPTSFYPAYLWATLTGYSLIILENSCYDCRVNGGDTIKPAYWPW